MTDAETTFDDGPLHIDFERGEVMVEGKPVALTSKEYDLLTELVRQRGAVLPYERVAELGWEDDPGPAFRTASKYSVIQLRRKLGWADGAEGAPFEHFAGAGYQYQSPNS